MASILSSSIILFQHPHFLFCIYRHQCSRNLSSLWWSTIVPVVLTTKFAIVIVSILISCEGSITEHPVYKIFKGKTANAWPSFLKRYSSCNCNLLLIYHAQFPYRRHHYSIISILSILSDHMCPMYPRIRSIFYFSVWWEYCIIQDVRVLKNYVYGEVMVMRVHTFPVCVLCVVCRVSVGDVRDLIPSCCVNVCNGGLACKCASECAFYDRMWEWEKKLCSFFHAHSTV